MIYFHACMRFTFTMRSFLSSWDKPFMKRMQFVPYSQIDPREPMPPGVHIFTDFERLRPGETAFVQALVDRMAQHPQSYTLLNNPATWSGRLGLNQALSAEGINDYRAFKADEVPDDLAFPAFVRFANEHSGSLADPVNSHDEIARLVKAHASGLKRRLRKNLLVVEQVDVRSADGFYRKYGAQKIGDALIPRHLFFSHDWVTKNEDIVEDWMIEEEMDFITGFDHHDVLNRAFDLAGLDYGRIDYGIVDGRIQVWEINTNPIVLRVKKAIPEARIPGQQISATHMLRQLHAMADDAPRGPAHRLFGAAESHIWHARVRQGARYDSRRK